MGLFSRNKSSNSSASSSPTLTGLTDHHYRKPSSTASTEPTTTSSVYSTSAERASSSATSRPQPRIKKAYTADKINSPSHSTSRFNLSFRSTSTPVYSNNRFEEQVPPLPSQPSSTAPSTSVYDRFVPHRANPSTSSGSGGFNPERYYHTKAVDENESHSPKIASSSSSFTTSKKSSGFTAINDRWKAFNKSTSALSINRDHDNDQNHSSGNSPISSPISFEASIVDKKPSRWRLPAKRASSLGFGGLSSQSANGAENDGGGFFVQSIRTVSRVNEDPVAGSAYESYPLTRDRVEPPLPALPPPSPILDPSHQRRSSSESVITRPPLNVRAPGSNSWRENNHDRTPSPTISVEAFKFSYANRAKSSVSLSSLDDATTPTERPRFEPSKSRRSSFLNENGQVQTLIAPRPQFTVSASGGSPNSKSLSSSSGTNNFQVHSRTTTSSSIDSYRQASNGVPGSLGHPPFTHSSSRIPTSHSQISLSSFMTAPDNDSQLDYKKEPTRSLSSALPRDNSSDQELKLIALYGSPSPTSETFNDRRSGSFPFEARRSSTPELSGPSTPVVNRTMGEMTGNTIKTITPPSFAVQPPTPQSTIDTSDTIRFNRRSYSTGDQIRSPSRLGQVGNSKTSWAHDGDEEDEAEESDDDDDVPLSQIKSKSQVDLSTASLYQSKPDSHSSRLNTHRLSTAEVEVLSDGGGGRKEIGSPSARRPLPTPPSIFGRNHARATSANAVSTVLSSSPEHTSTKTERPLSGGRRSLSALSLSTVSVLPIIDHRSSPALPTQTSPPRQPVFVDSPEVSTPTATSQPQSFTPPRSATAPVTYSSSSPESSALNDQSPTISDLGTSRSQDTLVNSVSSTMKLGGGAIKPERSIPTVKFAASHHDDRGSKARRSSLQPGSNLIREVPVRFREDYHPPRSNSSLGFNDSSRSDNGVVVRTEVEAGQTVFDRMKARHRVEAIKAIQIGKDLNGEYLHDDDDDDDDDEDDEEPLSNLPAKSVLSGAGTNGFAPQSSFGGFSPLTAAPPGVDPYLYASLPNDQKMQLHQRSQQMMQMMAQAAYQARAESVINGSYNPDSASSIGVPNTQFTPSHSHSQSLPFLQHNSPYMSPQPQFFGGYQQPVFSPGAFAHQPNFHYAPSMNSYAGSMMGYPTGPQSVIGQGHGGRIRTSNGKFMNAAPKRASMSAVNGQMGR